MQVANPQLKFYRKLEGTWKSTDSTCTAVLDLYAHLVITYGNFKLDSSYSCMETGLLYEAQMMNSTTNILGFAGMFYKRHDGEELKLQMGNTSLSDGTGNSYTVSCLWYGEEKLNLELTDTSNGQIKTLILTREIANAAPASGYVCECGYTGPFGKFCPNCGLPRREKNTFKCECGYSGEVGNFCPNCGKLIEKEYTCQCGYRSKNVKYCPNCGAPTGQQVTSNPVPAVEKATEPAIPAVPEAQEEKLGLKCQQCGAENQDGKCSVCGAVINPTPLFSISSFMSTNPPSRTYAIVYEYSDTMLLLDNNGKRRLISVDVIEPAKEIISKYRLDDPDFKDTSAMGIMGGSFDVGFKSGDKFILTSLQTHGFAVSGAQGELMALFNKA